MKARWIPAVVFLVLLAAAAVCLLMSSAQLPERVASHFGASGAPNGFMPKTEYLRFMLWFALGWPSLLVALLALLSKMFGAAIFSNSNYWMEPERRDETLGFLWAQAFALGSMLLLFLCGTHALVVEANKQSPVQMGGLAFAGLVGVFLAGMAWWALAFARRFKRPPGRKE